MALERTREQNRRKNERKKTQSQSKGFVSVFSSGDSNVHFQYGPIKKLTNRHRIASGRVVIGYVGTVYPFLTGPGVPQPTPYDPPWNATPTHHRLPRTR